MRLESHPQYVTGGVSVVYHFGLIAAQASAMDALRARADAALRRFLEATDTPAVRAAENELAQLAAIPGELQLC